MPINQVLPVLVQSAALLAVLFGCGQERSAASTGFGREDLLDPKACAACHPGHYQEWRGSMHAYAADDPVFLAMNARGQEETDGALGTFCVDCHAPMAVREGLTTDGLNLASLPSKYRGVTCYFCHNVASIDGPHNNALTLANDRVMRGSFDDPRATPAHASVYSSALDIGHRDSAALCGACHDVVLPKTLVGQEVALERTYAEWQQTLFGRRDPREGGLTCNGCHMPRSPSRQVSANTIDAPQRPSRRHDFEGVDLAMTSFPGRERQQLLVQRALSVTVLAEICVSQTQAIQITAENVGAGHNFPSGSSHDREVWFEVKAYAADGDLIYSTRAPSDSVALNTSVSERAGEMIVLRDRALTTDGEAAHMFWEVAKVTPGGLGGLKTLNPLEPGFHQERGSWLLNTAPADVRRIERITLTVRVQPIAMDVLDSLVDSGHLSPELREAVAVIDLLPNRCYEPELLAAYPDILVGGTSTEECDMREDRKFTLVWNRADAEGQSRWSRETTLNNIPADCVFHPSFAASDP